LTIPHGKHHIVARNITGNYCLGKIHYALGSNAYFGGKITKRNNSLNELSYQNFGGKITTRNNSLNELSYQKFE